MKEAVGYLTEDGKFFEGMDEAEEYEAFNALRSALVELCGVDVEVFTAVCSSIPNEIRRYINANEAATRYREIQASLSTQDQAGREGDSQAILEQQTSLDEPLPDMGSSQQQKALRLERAINGIGSGRTDASDVRSSEDMAVRTHTEPTKTRNVHRPSHLRKGKVE